MSTAASPLRSEATKTADLRILLMGVAGCGKSTVGAALGARLGLPYRDGDDLHPVENIAKMSRGEPLGDEDRWPWLGRVAETLAAMPGGIIGCSALKRRYRDRIRAVAGVPVTVVHLAGSRDLIEARMSARTGHFMPASLIESQFAALEPPGPDEGALAVNVGASLDAVVTNIIEALEARNP